MTAVVTAANGRQRTVKNLRWLHEHAADVEQVEIQPLEDERAYMRVDLRGGLKYETTWESREILRDYLRTRRTRISWVPVFWLNQTYPSGRDIPAGSFRMRGR